MPRKRTVREKQRLSLTELVEKAHAASAFTSPVVSDFLDYQEERLFLEWRNSQNPEEREKLFLQTQGLMAFRDYVAQILIAGEDAQRELQEKYDAEQIQLALTERNAKRNVERRY